MAKDTDWEKVFIEQAIVLNRKELWRMRWGAYIKKMREDYCNQCCRIKHCNRLRANELIRRVMARGDDCPDMYPIWERILDGRSYPV